MDDVHGASPAIPRRAALTRLGAAALAVGGPLSTRSHRSRLAQQNKDEEFERVMRLASVPSMSLAVIEGERISTRSLGVPSGKNEPRDSAAAAAESRSSASRRVTRSAVIGPNHALLARAPATHRSHVVPALNEPLCLYAGIFL